jgi:hypothetical protein
LSSSFTGDGGVADVDGVLALSAHEAMNNAKNVAAIDKENVFISPLLSGVSGEKLSKHIF